MQYKQIKAPFGWIGGKSKLAKDIVKAMPPHTTYIEVFGGALSVLYAKEPSKIEVVNDINSDLVNLHLAIRTNPQTLSFYLSRLLISRELFFKIRDKKISPRNKIERAAFYLYLISQSFGSKTDSFAMSAKAGRKPKDIYRSYHIYSKRLKHVTIENKSFEDLVKLYDRSADTLFYLDPPYVSTEGYYKNIGSFGTKEHKKLASLLSNIKGKFLLSYNDCAEVRELYKKFHIRSTKEIEYTLGKNVHKRDKKIKEVLISNFLL